MNLKFRLTAAAMSFAMALAAPALHAQRPMADGSQGSTPGAVSGGLTAGPSDAGGWQDVSTYLEQTVRGGILTGYGFAVFNEGGVLFQQAGGDQTLRSVEPLASASKLPAAAAIMTLVDQGKLDLDAPVSTYLKGHIRWPNNKSGITLRMLLSHTSGLPGNNAPSILTPHCLKDTHMPLKRCAQQIADTPLLHEPGTTFAYNSADYQLAGYIAVVVSGKQSWQRFFQDAIGGPLHWQSYGFTPSRAGNPLIGGGACSNLSDYVTFLQMILDRGLYEGQQLLSQQAIAEIEQNEIAGPAVYSPMPPVQYPGYGLGVFITAPDLYPGSPGPEFSDPGLYGSVPWYDRGLDYGAVLLIVDTDTTGIDVWNGLRPLIITRLTAGG